MKRLLKERDEKKQERGWERGKNVFGFLDISVCFGFLSYLNVSKFLGYFIKKGGR